MSSDLSTSERARRPSRKGWAFVLAVLAAWPLVSGLVPTVAAHSTDVDNAVINGGFELGTDGLLGWTMPSYGCCTGVTVTDATATPAPCESNHALRIQDQDYGAYVYQTVQSAPRTLSSGSGPAPSVVGALDFFANVYGTTGRVSYQSIEVLQGWPGSSPQFVALVAFNDTTIKVKAYDGTLASIPRPTTAGCHHFRLELNYAWRAAALFVDGDASPRLIVQGISGFPPATTYAVLVGDLAGSPASGAAPDVLWDGVYFHA